MIITAAATTPRKIILPSPMASPIPAAIALMRPAIPIRMLTKTTTVINMLPEDIMAFLHNLWIVNDPEKKDSDYRQYQSIQRLCNNDGRDRFKSGHSKGHACRQYDPPYKPESPGAGLPFLRIPVPKRLRTVTAEARGAVTAEVKPAANSPAPSMMVPAPPRYGSRVPARARKVKSPLMAVPVTNTAMEMIPPSTMATKSPERISLMLCPVEIPEPRKRL